MRILPEIVPHNALKPDCWIEPAATIADDTRNPVKQARGDAMATTDSKIGDTSESLFIGKGEQPAWLTLGLATRHGLVTGATGTGKTVSLQVMAEGFARAGVAVFAADIKGDLSGISEVG